MESEMTRQDLLDEIDSEFERYADGQGSISLEYLRSKVRAAVNEMLDGMSLDLSHMSEMLNKMKEV
jgi:hypothetical protein